MMGIVARSARVADGHDGRRSRRRRRGGHDRGREVPPALAGRGRSAAREGDRHVLDLHGGARAQRVHVHGARHRLDGGGLRRRAVVGGRRALRPAARRRARVREADARGGCGNGRPREVGRDTLDSGRRIMGFGHRVYRAEDPALADPQANGARARLTADRESPSSSRRLRWRSSSGAIPSGR